jgi:hypothetical protein
VGRDGTREDGDANVLQQGLRSKFVEQGNGQQRGIGGVHTGSRAEMGFRSSVVVSSWCTRLLRRSCGRTLVSLRLDGSGGGLHLDEKLTNGCFVWQQLELCGLFN